MKNLLLVLSAILLLNGIGRAGTLSLEEQQRIIDNYVAVTTGVGAVTPSLDAALGGQVHEHDHIPYKCGTPAVLEFYRNYDRLDPDLVAAAGAALAARPLNEYFYDTPGGRIRIHYDKSNIRQAAVWQANVDSDGDGVPNYVETLAGYADRAYAYMTDTLGYIDPVNDSGTPDAGDSRVDIYLANLGGATYGLTYPENVVFPGGTDAVTPSWVVIDHDFQGIPAYVGRPLEAAKVTIAHELFHTVHFSIDASEKAAWFEMTAVWMEEEQYDEVNDYYYYLPFFYAAPRVSIQRSGRPDLHEYASGIWPMYLSEKFGDDIIRAIWERSAVGWNAHWFLDATDYVIDSLIDSLYQNGTSSDSALADNLPANYAAAFAEFAVWNFFTGPYADQAPNDIGFPEKENFSYFPLDVMDLHRQYPVTVRADTNTFRPQPNGATYLRLENLQQITQDSLLNWFVYADTIPGAWGVTAIYQLEQYPDSHVVVTTTQDSVFNDYVEDLVGEIDLSKYRSVTLVLTPAVTDVDYILPFPQVGVGYSLTEPSSVNTDLVDLPAAVLAPYPNPAVVSELGGEPLRFRFRVPTDSTSWPSYPTAYLTVELYTVAGERVGMVEGRFLEDDRTGVHRAGIYEAEWNMKNAGGKDVASGAYLAYARLYAAADKKELLAEDHVKVAVIR